MASTRRQVPAPSRPSAHSGTRHGRWSRDSLRRNLELIGELSAPLLPSTLPISPPASRSASPSPLKRKAAPPPAESKKRLRTESDRSLPEEGELAEDMKPIASTSGSSMPRPAVASNDTAANSARAPPLPPASPSTVPVRRPRAGKISLRLCDNLHNQYHNAGRMLKYSGDARFWSTYSPSHKEYRPLANPPPLNSPYYKHGGLIARLELLDALVCFTYSIWNRDYSRRVCNRDTWQTIEAFLVWCKQKWQSEESTPDAEKAFLGLIWMIEGYIHGRKLVYGTNRSSTLERELEKTVAVTRASLAAAAVEATTSGSVNGKPASKSGTSPVMLPSPASLAPSANSTPTNRDGGTPGSNIGSVPSATVPAATTSAPSTLPSSFLPAELRHIPIPPQIAVALDNVSVGVSPRLVGEVKSMSQEIAAAQFCLNNAQAHLNLPIIARHFPVTFARMIGSTLSFNEEHEPDFEDTEGELFWPSHSLTGEGLGWVCLMGKAMIMEFGKPYSYRSLDGVVPKPKPEEEAESGGALQPQTRPSGATPLGYNSPLSMPR
ncbi:unnamed protein product [Mycena citricolor]|uniref:Uncharacterized protein n=1 Tax=Mycena citricolor TaxID=2018698 RepID=A0AAD2Q6M7_9AGAR|nr:unnamed protein product [Mycena citricolor]